MMWSNQSIDLFSKAQKYHFYKAKEEGANFYWSLCGHFVLEEVTPVLNKNDCIKGMPFEPENKCKICEKIRNKK